MKCETCRYWGIEDRPLHYSKDESPNPAQRYRYCMRIKPAWEAESTELAVVQDGSDYSASLITQPSFGCVLYQGK